MKVLYAVQGTGNGHVSRARVMEKALRKYNVNVDWVFSGKDPEKFFNMEVFGNYKVYRGLTFSLKDGVVSNFRTIFKNNILHFIKEVRAVKFDQYDLVLNDFEPVVAWAAKFRKVDSIGISRQLAFNKKIPIAGKSLIASQVLKWFAPAKTIIGLHWSNSDNELLPPIISTELNCKYQDYKEVLVYFPYVDKQKLINWFAPFSDYNFHIFHGCEDDSGFDHIKFYNFSQQGFHEVQSYCGGIISTSGFELSSEAIHMGHKLLVIPISNHMEQQSNAAALELIGRAKIIVSKFSPEQLERWLQQPLVESTPYPDVADELVSWILSSRNESLDSLSARLWMEFSTATQL